MHGQKKLIHQSLFTQNKSSQAMTTQNIRSTPLRCLFTLAKSSTEGTNQYRPKKCLLLLAAFLTVYTLNAKADIALGIADLYQKALDNDTQLSAAEAKYKAESLAPNIARAPLLPQVNLIAGRRRFAEQEIKGSSFGGEGNFSYDTDSLDINLTQSIFKLDYYIALKQSKSQAEKARLEFESAHQDLIVRLAEAYFKVLSAEETLKFAQSEKKAVARQLEQAQERFTVGLDPITDVKEAEAAYDLTEAEEISANNQLRNSIHALSVITNYDTQTLRPLSEYIPIIKPTPESMTAWVDRSLSQNTELLAQQIATNIAEQEIKLQRAGHYPSLDLFANRNESNFRSGSPTPRELKEFVIGIELNIPIFSGQGTHYRTKQAVELHNESLEKLKGTHRETKRAAREAYLNVIASISRVAALKRAKESAQTALEANEAGFRVGTRTSVDVLLALKDLFRTHRDYADTRYDYLLNTLRLKKVAGILESQDIQQLNNHLQDVFSTSP